MYKLLLMFIAGFIFSAQSWAATPADTSFTVYSAYQKAVKDYPFIEIVKTILPDHVIPKRGLIYSYTPRKLSLDLFLPADAEKTTPAVLLVHGGGWHSGNKSHLVPLAQQLAARGFAAAAIEYRLSTEALYPAAVMDIKASVRWMRKNAASFNINPNRIALLGCSSGGQLAALAGVTNGQEYFDYAADSCNSDVQAIINIDGILDFTTPESRLYDNDPQKPSAAALWFGGSYLEKPKLWREASGLFYAGQNTPPILFINSSLPRFHSGRDEMIATLDSFGIYHETREFGDSPHPFWLFHPWFEQTVEYTARFLEKIFIPNK